ncbi:MAG: ParB N-terminal domain-containing protein [Phycisphaerales bacterium]|jgi:hypothetical protein|nr:ParB N-terminal domain-containing protein [Phycisphaerales bacterium]
MPNHILPYSEADPPSGSPVTLIDIEKLLLDPDNPRLSLPSNPSQLRILRELYQEHRLEELMSSLLSNGYFHEEPLVAIPASRNGYFTVVEGNRRLAALKLLLQPEMRARIKATHIPDATSNQLNRLKKVPVKVYDNRQQVLPYLGFRHITGVKEWDAASKAKYIHQLKNETQYTLEDIAKMIGDTYNMTERLYLGWNLLKQAEDSLGIDTNDFYKFPFSYMYDAVRMPEIRAFLGVDAGKYVAPKSHSAQLKELIEWLFGSKPHEKRPVVDRKDQLKKLAAIVSDKKATTAIRQGVSIDDAFQETIGEENLLIEWLTRASRELDRSKGVIHRHHESVDVKELVDRCYDTIRRLDKEMKI